MLEDTVLLLLIAITAAFFADTCGLCFLTAAIILLMLTPHPID